MPRRDGTGPDGKGPKTGRGAGDCDSTQQNKRGVGRGRGRRQGSKRT